MAIILKSNLDLVKECDNFPYPDDDLEKYTQLLSSLYKFKVHTTEEIVGLIQPWVVEKLVWTREWKIDHETKTISPVVSVVPMTIARQNSAIKNVLDFTRKERKFRVLDGWRDELYQIYGAPVGTVMERAGSSLFGIVTVGVHMTAYTRSDGVMKIWVPRRAKSKDTYGGMLDNTVAGGISAGEMPFEGLVREAAEEASLPEELVRKSARSGGVVTYFYVRDERAGGETGLLQPECEYVYDLQLEEAVVPKPGDNEVEDFYLWTVEEVQKALAEGQFKPNCAMVLLDFFVRHGIITAGNERDYIEIVSRMHRKLPFPTASHRHLKAK
ncbi:hypothetical protein MMC06_002311 [Schaereria dolodes]|nr:hypothetical protein [Schaereria dolodes]